ncbi:uncharacterized protein LOC144583544 [Pogona vitticeps]
MPLTRSQMAEMGEVREPQVDQGSEEEFGSVQDESTGEQNPELKKMLIVQQHELRVREMEERLERERMAEREKQRQFELELQREKMAFELRKLELMNQNNNNNRDSEGGQLSKTDLKKFPVYHKGDCPEVFFSLVERAFVDFSVRETEKMTIMRSLISGSLAEVYAEMPEELLRDFAEFKKLVFARHGINAEQLRQRFRSLTKKPEQTFTQVGAQLVRLLEKWLSQEGTETFQQLKDLIALEQFYSVLHGELKFQVRERKPKSVAEAAEIADFISQIRKPLGEGKSISKPKETYSKYSQGPGKNQQVGGAHGEGKPSDMKQRPQILEGKPKQDEKDSKYSRKCYFCQGKGHLISECEKLKQLKRNVPHDLSGTKPKAVFCVQKEQSSLPLREPVAMATQSGTVTSADQAEENGPLVEVKRCLLVRTDSQLFETAGVDVGILDHQYRGLRDTCSQVTLCHPDIIPREYIILNESMKVAGIEGQVISLPVAEVPVNFQGWRGVWRLAISSTLPAAVLVGNDLAEHVKRVLVITRSQATTGTVQGGTDEPETEAEGSSEAVVETLTTDSRFGQEQKADATLQKCFEQVTDAQLTPETPVRFREKKGILYRETLRNISKGGDGIRSQLVVPEKYRPMILQRGHSDMFAAHLGVNKTQQRITQNFYWPEIGKQIKEFCKQCDVCQRQGNNRDRTKAKLCPLPVIDTPFKCILVDIVGPLPKATKRGNRFILTIVDHATRYPEAIPLTNIETNTVADALVGYMSRMGFASEIITDLGTSFTSKLMKRLWQICGIKHKETTAYHPESNGLTEKFNGTLMRMIRAYLAENPNNWDQKLQSLLFAYRSVPQASTGFSPFELLFGRRVKGPLDLIKQNWEQITQDDPQDVVTYIDTLMNDLKRNLELAAENLQAQKVRQKTWYDHKARERHFDPGEEVLWLRPCRENKLQLKWAGPYRVISKMSDLNYLIEQEENQARRVVHVNALKPYYRGEQRVLFAIKAAESEEAELPFWEGRGEVKYNPDEVKISPALTQDQQQELKMLLIKYQKVFSNKPGIVKGVMHRIHTGDAPPQAVSPYRVTGPYRDKVRKELDEMLRENIIVPSSSPWSSPIVLVDKPDGSIRFCVDYRKLNRVTTPDAYPMPRLDNLIETIGGCRFISSLDLVKGYWQLRIDPRDQEKTAFCSPFGLYEFRVLSFGLRNAPATFQRLMDQTLAGLSDFTVAYIDDIGIFSNTWEDHLKHLELVLQRLSAAGLTVKASKCQLGSPEIKYLGHIVGGGVIKPLEAKIEAVRDWPRPNTKKKVKSFLGLVGYYRKFIPRFSEIAAPLTDLTRKKTDDRIPWTSDCEEAFQRLKEALINYPVLRAPDFDWEFIIYTDASNSGVGAVLCQEDENGDQHPVSYLSRKLQKGERHLATVEKECLAIVYAIQKAKPYIWGRHFTLCTDHSPLQWLKTMKSHNSKLMRWALNLQDYDFEVKVVRGSVNCVADALSRRPED